MENNFNKQVEELFINANEIINTATMVKANKNSEKFEIDIQKDYKSKFFKLIDKVNLSLMEDNDNFYGYFLFQMSRDIRFDISSPTAVNFKDANMLYTLIH